MKNRNILYTAIVSSMIVANSSFTFAMASDIGSLGEDGYSLSNGKG